jgi:hypothetical protein
LCHPTVHCRVRKSITCPGPDWEKSTPLNRTLFL